MHVKTTDERATIKIWTRITESEADVLWAILAARRAAGGKKTECKRSVLLYEALARTFFFADEVTNSDHELVTITR